MSEKENHAVLIFLSDLPITKTVRTGQLITQFLKWGIVKFQKLPFFENV